MIRFDQPAYPTAFFSDLIYVVCPQCRQVAKVETHFEKEINSKTSAKISILRCKHCGLLNKAGKKWFGFYQAFVNNPCGNCGSSMVFSSKPLKEVSSNLRLTCPTCKEERTYIPHCFRYKNDYSKEPYFGLDIYLQIGIKNHTLWLYNLKHLKYLKDYVAATLRDDDNRNKYSMITNLPQWIKSSKNRDIVLKKIEKLEMEIKTKIKNKKL